MHEVHRRVGLQQVAPGPFARMRLARDQQHPQPVAHAVDLHHGGVVAVGQFAFGLGHAEGDDVLPAMLQDKRHLDVAPQRNARGERIAAVDGDLDRDLARRLGRGHGALVLDPQDHADLFADDPEGRGVLHHQPPVPVVGLARQQQVHRRGQRRQAVEVMQLPVRQQHHPRQPRLRDLGQRLGQRGHQKRAAVPRRIAKPHDLQVGVRTGGDLGFQRGQRRLGLLGPSADPLAGALVHHDQHDVRQRVALFFLQAGIGQCEQQHGRPDRPHPGAEQPAPARESQQQGHARRQRGQHAPRQQRIEDDGACCQRVHQFPSLSRRAGTWTWSDL